MRIKHFAGYGSVNAKKIYKRTADGKTLLKVLVTGNHEWGLVRNDAYILKVWLINRFDKEVGCYPWDIEYSYDWGYTPDGIEWCEYTFIY